MRYSQEFIERVQESNNLVDIVSQYTQLKPSGGGLMGRCPFPDHPEKTPSFSVSEVKQVYHCFGCGKKGNLFTFLREMQGLNFVEAVHFLANRAGLSLPQEIGTDAIAESEERQRKRSILTINQEAVRYFQKMLGVHSKQNPVGDYLEMRGVHRETVEIFGLGYAPPEWEGLVQHLQVGGYNLELAEEARLVRQRREGKTGYYDLFRDRLMFPIFSPLGEPLAFGGRIILEGEPKYLNSPESLVFHKGRTLYGLHQTAKFIRAEDLIILVEGYMDLISLFQAGIKNVAATMGTALTPEHAKLISRITKNVVVLFDGDSAGREASERSLPILLSGGLYVKGLVLPDNLDPDDYIREFGSKPMENSVSQAPDLFSLLVDRWLVGFRGEATEKIQFVDRIRPLLASIADPRLRELYFEEVALKLGVHFHWLNQALNHYRGKESFTIRSKVGAAPELPPESKESMNEIGAQREEEPPKISLKSVDKAELNLLRLLLKSRANFDFGRKENVGEFVVSLEVKKILSEANEVYGQDPNKFDRLTSLLISYVDQPELLFWNESGPFEEFDSGKEEKLVRDCIKRVRENFLRNKLKFLAKNLKDSPENSAETLTKIMELQRHRIGIGKDNS